MLHDYVDGAAVVVTVVVVVTVAADSVVWADVAGVAAGVDGFFENKPLKKFLILVNGPDLAAGTVAGDD